MAADGKSFAISLGVNGIVGIICFLIFGYFRRLPYTRKYYSPKRYMHDGSLKPHRLPDRFYAWIWPVYRYTQDEVIALGGMDAAMYLRILAFGAELFTFLTIFCLIMVLPVNLTGNEVYNLSHPAPTAASNFTYWVPSPSPPAPGDDSNQPAQVIKAPNFFQPTPPAPPGLEWWHYRPEVPPLPQPQEVLGSNYSAWGWRYNSLYQASVYTFSNMDTLTMSNVSPNSRTLWVHLMATWVVSLYIYRLLWRYNVEAVALRIHYLNHVKKGAESHTVLVQDIPGVEFGTIPQRIDGTVFRFLPDRLKNPVKHTMKHTVAIAGKGAAATAKVAGSFLPDSRLVLGSEPSASEAAVKQRPTPRQTKTRYFDAVDTTAALDAAIASGTEQPEVLTLKVPATAVSPTATPQTSITAATGSATAAEAAAQAASAPAFTAPQTPQVEAPPATPSAAFARHRATLSASSAAAGGSGALPSVASTGAQGLPPGPVRPLLRTSTEVDAWAKCSRYLETGHSMQELVEKEYNELYPGEVEAVHVVYDTSSLEALDKEYHNEMRALTDLLDEYTSMVRRGKEVKKRKTVTVVGVQYGMWGKERYGVKPRAVDGLDWHTARLAELRRLIAEESVNARKVTVPAAFVTFRTRRAQVIASTSMQHHDQRAWRVSAAPGPDEIVWRNLRWRKWERKVRTVLVWSAFVCLTLFYMIPVGAVQALIEVSRLQQVPFFREILNIDFVRSILTAILPGLVLKIFLLLLPMLLVFMNRRQGMNSLSKIDFGVVHKFFIFQVVTVFFGSFLVGSFLTQANQWIKDPASALNLLGTAAPLTSIFFMTYLVLQGFSAKPLNFLRIVGLVLFWIQSKLAATERAKARLWQNQTMAYGDQVPDHTIAILLGLVFCIINPLICPVALVYFIVTSITEKYNLLYVFQPKYQSGGKVWRQVFEQVIVAVMLFQLMMLGLLSIKQSFAAVLVIPLPFITLLFRSTCSTLFRRPQQILSLRGAADLDRKDHSEPETSTPQEQKELEQLYLADVFKFDEEEYHAVMDETRMIDAVLKGEAVLAPERLPTADNEMDPVTPAAPETDIEAPAGDDDFEAGDCEAGEGGEQVVVSVPADTGGANTVQQRRTAQMRDTAEEV
ncbi:hypothetical protein WJX72_012500 [[Myrmecia] bisecta]|uniref:Uncharacterized protein n=1 Tax=[Myrmecia] bisecta TaxID=41462 RepID=A0AAW1P9J0_9CHLO